MNAQIEAFKLSPIKREEPVKSKADNIVQNQLKDLQQSILEEQKSWENERVER